MVGNSETSNDRPICTKPPLLRNFWPGLAKKFSAQKFHLFLDFDGTLSPVRTRPELANLSPKMADRLLELSSYMPLAIVSGRDREDVTDLVGIDSIFYAGCHGFDIEDSRLPSLPFLDGQCSREQLMELGLSIKKTISDFGDVILKIKKWAVAVHYRSASPEQADRIEKVLMELLTPASQFRFSQGERVIEVMPNVPWDKGRAVLWLGDQFLKQHGPGSPIYIGDDTSDEDAFHALREQELTILVSRVGRPSSAKYRVEDPEEVGWFLDQLLSMARS